MPIHRITTPLTALCLALVLATGLQARPALTQLQAGVAAELPGYGYAEVDVRDLSLAQLTHNKHLIHSSRSVSEIRSNIGAVLGDSLIRSLFRR